MTPRMAQHAAVLGGCAILAIASASHQAFGWAHAGGWGGRSWGAGDTAHYEGPRGSTATSHDGSWSASGFRGGTASGGGGSWSGTSYRGGTASGGDGSWHATGAYGGTASGGEGSWHATGAYGNTAYGGYNHYGGGYYYGYHPPTVVNSYSTGCYNCGGWNAGAAWAAGVAGVAAGTAIGAAATAAARPAYVMNDIYPALPAGCAYSPVGGLAYYNCAGTWFSPYYGANGLFYRVVPAP